jgi:hypothetical protein
MRTLLIQFAIMAIETWAFVSSPSIMNAFGFGFVAGLTLMATASVLRGNLTEGARS